MLIEEVEKRSYQRWTLSEQEPASGPVVYLGQRTALAQRFPRASAALPAAPVGAEGYAIAAEGNGSSSQATMRAGCCLARAVCGRYTMAARV
jgi:hypothetical protein